ncbi:MAG: hypothetical protein HN467_17800, partial [Opitutae bacterium]|nr:hypothetical protein [Opitutae bacterium]
TCVRRTGTGSRRTPGTTSWASVSVSRQKKKNGVTRREPEGPWRAEERPERNGAAVRLPVQWHQSYRRNVTLFPELAGLK